MHKKTKYPDILDNCINNALKELKTDLSDSRALAKCVLALSDYFIQHPSSSTPWQEKWAQVAYLCYYLPLNATRLMTIVEEADNRSFFQGITQVFDFGAGLATASITLAEKHNFQFHLIEQAIEPQKIIENHFSHFRAKEWQRSFHHKQLKNAKETLAIFSYSLTELPDLPEWTYDCEALMIVEPSTQQDGRKLLELRTKLLNHGFHVWAPCTHEGPCPLLTQSKTDWCHDRVHFEAPEWFLKLEEQLPMKNRTLTMSYLLLRKLAPPKISAARVVGDRLNEKGKDRQMICRGPDREFLAWMHKTKIEQEIPRGVLIEVPDDIQKVSNELRVQTTVKVLQNGI